jgi:hypothetical protein
MNNMQLHGMNVVVSSFIPLVPKVSLSADFHAASEGCIRDMNAWLSEMFGTKEQAMLIGDRTIVVGPETYDKLKKTYWAQTPSPSWWDLQRMKPDEGL